MGTRTGSAVHAKDSERDTISGEDAPSAAPVSRHADGASPADYPPVTGLETRGLSLLRGPEELPSALGGTTALQRSHRPGAGGDPHTPGVVHVVTTARFRHQAICSCEWTHRRRLARSFAVVDGLAHASATGCHPGVPLVLPKLWAGRRPPVSST